MTSDADASSNHAARAFLHVARALEHWDLVELRNALDLPAETPLDPLADLAARLHHLPRRTPESVEEALRRSPARPWIERRLDLRTLAATLPAAIAFASIADAKLHSTDVGTLR